MWLSFHTGESLAFLLTVFPTPTRPLPWPVKWFPITIPNVALLEISKKEVWLRAVCIQGTSLLYYIQTRVMQIRKISYLIKAKSSCLTSKSQSGLCSLVKFEKRTKRIASIPGKSPFLSPLKLWDCCGLVILVLFQGLYQPVWRLRWISAGIKNLSRSDRSLQNSASGN